ncbi:MAG: copper chaperone PCu(A)C, partial [Pseudomonadota bacterium]|nr:copper chaperone PCu(A)C [Pseudomonadota bacterium]
MRLIGSAFALVMLLIGLAAAGEVREHGGLMVKDVWSRATPARNGVAYMTIFNHGHHMDRLVAAETPVSKNTEIHTHSMKDGVMRMRRMEAVEVHPGEPAVLAPGGNHVMFMGLHEKLIVGQSFPVTLIFERAGKVTVEVKVGKAGAMGHDSHKHGGHKKI